MHTTPDKNDVQRHRLGIGDHVVVTKPALLTTSGLGSCVGVALYDDYERAGLAHCMLPSAAETDDEDAQPAKYVDTGVDVLYDELTDAGAAAGGLRAKVVGGSDMLGFSGGPTVGERNAAAARAALEERGVPLVAADTGGEQGRSLEFEAATARLSVAAADGSGTVL